MERHTPLAALGRPLLSSEPLQEFLITDAAMEALKGLAPDGCLLCTLDTWEEEEGD